MTTTPGEDPMTTEPPAAPVTADDLLPGAMIRVPAGYRGRPYCLEITSRVSVSKATGAVSLVGHVLSVNGTTTRKRPLTRSVVVMPDRIELVRRAPATEG
jgi:hypothetical protein